MMMMQPAGGSVVVVGGGGHSSGATTRGAEEWRPLAAKGRGLLIAAGVLQLLAGALVIGGAAADWWTFEYRASNCSPPPAPCASGSFLVRVSPLAIKFEAEASASYAGSSASTRYSPPSIVNTAGVVLGGAGLLLGALFSLVSSAIAFSAG